MMKTQRIKHAVQNLDACQYDELRTAYYKAAEGIAKLDAVLADISSHVGADGFRPLRDEWRIVNAAREELNNSQLGSVI